MRNDTALLFGALCHERGITAEPMTPGGRHLGRTRQWVSALKRGEFTPTMKMADLLDRHTGRQAGEEGTFVGMLVELELEPYGTQAIALRTRFGLPSYSPEPADVSAAIGAGLSPIGSSVDDRDRLLISGPLLVAGGLLALQVIVALWAAGALGDLAVPSVAGLGAVLVVLMSLKLRPLEWVLSHAVYVVRYPYRELYAEVCLSRETAGLPISHQRCWHQRDESRYLTRVRRQAAVRYGLLADYSERVAVLLTVNVAAAAFLVVSTSGEVWWSVNVAAAVLVVIALAVAVSAAWSGAYWYEGELSPGLGLDWAPDGAPR